MRNVVYVMNISIDGNCDHTNFTPQEEIYEYFTNLFQDVDLIVDGRKSYQLMFPYWSDVAKNQSGTKGANEFAEAITRIDKIVISNTLHSVQGNARIVRESPGDVIRKLKQQPGKKISVGGVSLRSQLMELGLIDEFHFIIHPVIAGEGKRMLEGINLPGKLNLTLVDAKAFKSGCVALHYTDKS